MLLLFSYVIFLSFYLTFLSYLFVFLSYSIIISLYRIFLCYLLILSYHIFISYLIFLSSYLIILSYRRLGLWNTPLLMGQFRYRALFLQEKKLLQVILILKTGFHIFFVQISAKNEIKRVFLP